MKLVVQIIGPRGGVQVKKTFRGPMARTVGDAIIAALDGERERRRRLEELAPDCSVGGPHHELRRGAREGDRRTWTCKTCGGSVTVPVRFNRTQAGYSAAFQLPSTRKPEGGDRRFG